MSAKKSKTFFKTLTAILVLLLFFGGYYIYSSGIFGASVTENISEHSITDEERLIEYEEYGITYAFNLPPNLSPARKGLLYPRNRANHKFE